MEKKQFNLEQLTVPIRFILPLAFCGFIYAYHNDIQWFKKNFEDIKNTQQIMWKQMDDFRSKDENRFAYVYQQCCKEAQAPSGT